MSRTSDRVNLLAKHYRAELYLELGTGGGYTFPLVEMPWRTAVDERFAFDRELIAQAEKGCAFFQGSSDAFFAALAEGGDEATAYAEWADGERPRWDIIVMSGANRVFADYWREFNHTLSYSHADTIWLINYTVPSDSFSANPDGAAFTAGRAASGGGFWYGDVYKTVLAIHDFLPDISYCTVPTAGYPQTFAWRSERSGRTPAFGLMETIAELSYDDLLTHAYLMLPATLEQVPRLLGMSLDPAEFRDEYATARLTDFRRHALGMELDHVYRHCILPMARYDKPQSGTA